MMKSLAIAANSSALLSIEGWPPCGNIWIEALPIIFFISPYSSFMSLRHIMSSTDPVRRTGQSNSDSGDTNSEVLESAHSRRAFVSFWTMSCQSGPRHHSWNPLAYSSFIALSLSFIRFEEKLLFNVRPSNESAIMDDTPPFIIIAAFITTQAPPLVPMRETSSSSRCWTRQTTWHRRLCL